MSDKNIFLEGLFLNYALDKIDEEEMKKEVDRLRFEIGELKQKLNYKNLSVKSFNYQELAEEYYTLKKKLGFSDDEILKDLKKHSPYKKGSRVGTVFVIISSILLLVAVVCCFILTRK